MNAYHRAELWSKIGLVAQAILDQSKNQDLNMVQNRHTYLGTLLDQLEGPCNVCLECGERKGRLHFPTCGKRAEGAAYVLCEDCKDCDPPTTDHRPLTTDHRPLTTPEKRL